MIFQLDTSGEVYVGGIRYTFDGSAGPGPHLTPFTQGYVEAALTDIHRRQHRLLGSELQVNDTIGVWWAPNRDTIVSLRPYTGPLQELAAARIAGFAIGPGMTIEANALFDLVARPSGIGATPKFSDLAPETLARIIEDCERYQASRVFNNTAEGTLYLRGRSFWEHRQIGAREGFPPLTLYLGDDGKLYLREAA